MNNCFIKTPLGIAELREENNALSMCQLRPDLNDSDVKEPSSPILKQAKKQLKAYFNGTLRKFTMALSPKGTDFQQSVWRALSTIPYGIKWSYQDLATAIGNEKASRAVGNANGKNPIGIIIPCHRVIQKNGRLGGYSGGMHIKEALLSLEEKTKTKGA